MRTVIYLPNDQVVGSGTKYWPISPGFGVPDSGDAFPYKTRFPINGVLKEMWVGLDQAPGVTAYWTLTVRKNGSDTALKIIISDPDIYASNLVDSLDISAGDVVNIKIEPTNSPADTGFRFMFVFESNSDNVSLVLGSNMSSPPLSSDISYNNLSGCSGLWDSAQPNRSEVMATAGTFKKLYIDLDTPPDLFGDGGYFFFTIFKNGLPTSVSATVSGTGVTSGSDLIHSVNVVAGDTISIEANVVNGSSALTASVSWSLEFDPDTNGESIIAMTNLSNDVAVLPGFDNVVCIYSGYSSWGDDIVDNRSIANLSTLKKMYVLIDNPPGMGNSIGYNVRVNDVDTDLYVLISDDAVSGSNLIDVADTIAGDLITLRKTVGGDPNVPGRERISFITDTGEAPPVITVVDRRTLAFEGTRVGSRKMRGF